MPADGTAYLALQPTQQDAEEMQIDSSDINGQLPPAYSDCVTMYGDNVSSIIKMKAELEPSPGGIESEGQSHGHVKKSWRSKAASIRILFACFFCNTLTAIHFSAFPVYYVILTDFFGVSKATAGWVGSTGVCMSYAAGIFISPAISLWSSRWAGAAGGLLVALGLIMSSTATSISALVISYGLITGTGIAAAVMCPLVETQQHFKKNRPLAHGVSMMGFSLGSLVSSLLIASLLRTFSLRGALLIHGAIMLHITPLSFLFRRHFIPPACATLRPCQNAHLLKTSVAVTQTSGEGKPSAAAKTSRLLGVFREMFDFTPLTDCLFNCFMVATIMFRTGTTVLMMNVPSRAVSLGLPMGDAALLLSLISVGQISTRLPTSIAANFISSRARHIVVVVGMVLCGIPGLLSQAATTFASSAALSICFGLGLGLANTLLTTLQTDLFGAERVARLSALTNLFSSFTGLAAPPMAGWMYDVTLSYVLTFLFAGMLSLGGAVVVAIILPLQARKRRYSDKDELALSNVSFHT